MIFSKVSMTLELTPDEMKKLSPIMNVLGAVKTSDGFVKATVIMDKSVAGSRNGQRLFRRGHANGVPNKWVETAR